MLEGICHQCKVHYHGQSLNNLNNQVCLRCGSALEMRNEGFLVHSTNYKFRAEKYQAGADQEEWEDLCSKNLLLPEHLN